MAKILVASRDRPWVSLVRNKMVPGYDTNWGKVRWCVPYAHLISDDTQVTAAEAGTCIKRTERSFLSVLNF
jgi:hypothetical protein